MTNAIVGHIVAGLDVDTGEWNRGIGNARRALESNGAAMNKSLAGIEKRFGQLNSFVGTVVGVALAKSFVAGANRAFEFADAIQESARQAGMAASTFQELEYTQRQNGGSQESWNKGIQHFNNLIGEAADGSRTAIEALERVGIAQKDLLEQDVATLYTRASDALSKYATSGDRVNATMAVFGKAAKTNANAFALSADEIARFRREAHAAGQVMDEEYIKRAKEANDEMDKFTRVIGVQLTQAFVSIAPLLVKGAKLLADIGEMAGWAARKIGLISAVTDEQKYQALLEQRLALSEKIARIESVPAAGRMYQGITEDASKLRTELAALDKQIQAINAGRGSGEANAPAAVSSVKPKGGSGQGEQFSRLIDELKNKSAAASAEMTMDEGEQARQRMAIAQQEYMFKAEQMNMSAEQRAQFAQTMQEYELAQAQMQAGLDMERNAKELEDALLRQERIRMQYDSEFTMANEQYTAMAELDQLYKDLGLERDSAYQAAATEIATRGMDQRTANFVRAAESMTRFDEMSWGQRADAMGNALGTMSSFLNTESKKQFEINKKMQIAQAVIAAISSAVNAYNSASAIPFVGWILGPIAAAAALAAGVANVNKIKSTQFGGGGSPGTSVGGSKPSVPSVKTPTPPAETMAQAPSTPTRAGRTMNVYLVGGARYTAQEVRDLLVQVDEERADNGTTNVYG